MAADEIYNTAGGPPASSDPLERDSSPEFAQYEERVLNALYGRRGDENEGHGS